MKDVSCDTITIPIVPITDEERRRRTLEYEQRMLMLQQEEARRWEEAGIRQDEWQCDLDTAKRLIALGIGPEAVSELQDMFGCCCYD